MDAPARRTAREALTSTHPTSPVAASAGRGRLPFPPCSALPDEEPWSNGHQPISGLRVIGVQGAVDRAGIERLRGRCLAERDSGARMVAVDFSRMTDCPSALFLALLQINASFRATGTRLHLIGLAEAACEIAGGTRPVRPPPGAAPGDRPPSGRHHPLSHPLGHSVSRSSSSSR